MKIHQTEINFNFKALDYIDELPDQQQILLGSDNIVYLLAQKLFLEGTQHMLYRSKEVYLQDIHISCLRRLFILYIHIFELLD